MGTSQWLGGDPKGFNSIYNPSLWFKCSLTIFVRQTDSSLVPAIGARQPIVTRKVIVAWRVSVAPFAVLALCIAGCSFMHPQTRLRSQTGHGALTYQIFLEAKKKRWPVCHVLCITLCGQSFQPKRVTDMDIGNAKHRRLHQYSVSRNTCQL